MPVPFLLSTKVTLAGSVPVSLSVGVGTPVADTGNVTAVPTANVTTVVPVGLVIAAACVTTSEKD